ncbi:hypothetical protein R1sor_001954 [Riccia sorocarpa]|uniref:RRM domain-containing protein n=1 Tax=Riccia sorocarpa TaxID=122646 RepID=A0ABD3H0I8_9MARC
MTHFGRAGPPDIRDTYSLLVLNITFRTSADDLYPLFDRYGKVVDIFIPRDRRTGESRGFAFVRYKHAEEAQKAIERLDGRNVDGRDMVVQYAKYGRDMESIHRGKITQGSPNKYTSRSRSRSPRRPKSPVRGGGRRHFGPPSHMQASPPRGRDGRDRYPGPPQGGRHRDSRDDHREREREREHRPRSRSRDRYERDRHREREREHPRRRSPTRSRSRSRSRVRVHEEERHRSQSKAAGRKPSPAPRGPSPGRNAVRSASRSISRSPPRASAEPSKEPTRNGNDSPRDRKRMDSVSPKQQSLSPERGINSPARRSPSPVERDSLSPVKRRSESPERRSPSPVRRRSPSVTSPQRPSSSLTPEPQSPFAED